MGVEDLLTVRLRERAALLRRVEQVIRRDCRVRAAWIMGSVARGEDDALSDLDLFIVVADDSIAQFIDNRRVHAAEPARSLLLLDNLANAPAGGAYLLAMYEGKAGPQNIDWFWQAESMACRQDDGKILFDRAGLSAAPGARRGITVDQPTDPPLGPNPSPTDLLTHKIAFFWAMSFVVAKYIARRDGESVARMTGVVTRTLKEAAALCHSGVAPSEGYEAMVAGIEAAPATDQLQVLRELSRHAEALGGQAAAQGVVLPSEAVTQVYRFFELAEALVTRDVCLLRNPR